MGAKQVPIWTVPFRRNPFFTGREEVLSQLHTVLQNASAAALSQSLAISGLGGIGKTQTAVEYAFRYRGEYQAVFCMKSSTAEELAEDFESIAKLLELPERYAQEQSLIVAAVKRWFETHGQWLLIFDNADNLETLLDYIPQGTMGHTLITTRAHAIGGIATKIEMPVMNSEEGARFLLKRAGLIKQTAPLEQVKEIDLHLASSIAYELGGLPLALDQAGAYLEETGESLSNYLTLYEEQRARLLQRRGGIRSDHASVATMWTLALQSLELSSSDAVELVHLYAFLAPDQIPEELLILTKHLLNSTLLNLATDQVLFNKAIETLLSYSLIQRDPSNKTLSIHRLVQAVIKDGISKTQQTQWAACVVQMISYIFPFNEDAPWVKSQRYLSLSLLAVEYISKLSFTFTTARNLLFSLANYFRSRGQYSEAVPLLQLSRTITERNVGPGHPEVASNLNSLATIYKEQGKYKQAEPLYQKALAIYVRQLDPDDPEVAGSLTTSPIFIWSKANTSRPNLSVKELLLSGNSN